VAGFIAPCLPTKTTTLHSGDQWLHEIKHDGFRIIARKKGAQVRLYSRPGNDLTRRFPLIVETLERLRSRSCIIDGEAVACDDNGVASFDLIRNHRAILTSEATVVRYFQERMPYGLFVPGIP
jgi:bifunctional non-homologous end joining protein LigD